MPWCLPRNPLEPSFGPSLKLDSLEEGQGELAEPELSKSGAKLYGPSGGRASRFRRGNSPTTVPQYVGFIWFLTAPDPVT